MLCCNRQGGGFTSGGLISKMPLWQAQDMQASSSAAGATAQVRFSFVLAAALVVGLYLAFLAAHLVLLYQMHGQTEVLRGEHQLPQKDFGLFWCAGNGLISQLAQSFHFHFSQSFRQVCQNDILSPQSPIDQAWPYPPTMGFLVAPFALLPLGEAFWVWRLFSVCVAALLLRRAGLSWQIISLGLASPAALHDFTNGQNGTLTGAWLLAALLLAGRGNRLAGFCAGLLSLKPHLGVGVAVAALRLRAWRMIGWAVAVAFFLAVAATYLWGLHGWVWFFGIAQHDEWLWASRPIKQVFPGAAITVYDMVRSFGLADRSALVVQGLASILAICLIWHCWAPGRLKLMPRVIITVCLNVWIVPHGFMYDLVAFSVAMGALVVVCKGWQRFAACLLWLMAGYTGVISVMLTHLLLFPLVALAGAALAWKVRDAPAWR